MFKSIHYNISVTVPNSLTIPSVRCVCVGSNIEEDLDLISVTCSNSTLPVQFNLVTEELSGVFMSQNLGL